MITTAFRKIYKEYEHHNTNVTIIVKKRENDGTADDTNQKSESQKESFVVGQDTTTFDIIDEDVKTNEDESTVMYDMTAGSNQMENDIHCEQRK